MITLNRKTSIEWVLNPTAFQAINQQSLVVFERPLGTSVGAVKKMIACAEEMEMLLPDVLGVTPNSSGANWQAALADHWHNFGFDVPSTGKPLNNSLVFDINDTRRKAAIDKLIAFLKLDGVDDEANEKVLYDHIIKTVKEEQLYKYMSPVDVEQYLAWRYCLVSNKVANDPEDMRKSNNIDFYLMDESKAAARKEAINKLKNLAIDKYYELKTSKDATKEIDSILIANEMVHSLRDLKAMSPTDKSSAIMDLAIQNPSKFMELLEDNTKKQKAEIKKWVMASLVRQIPGTSTYVDNSDPTIVLGSTLMDAVSYVSADVNAAYINELRLKFKNDTSN